VSLRGGFGQGGALTQAALQGRTAVVRALLAAGADVNAHEKDNLPPLLAALTNHQKAGREITQLLLEAGADVHARADWGEAALHYTTWHPKGADLVALLVRAGADPDAPDGEGRTPLMTAVHKNDRRGPGRLALVNALLAAGARVDARDHRGWTALHHAVCGHHPEAEVRRLLEAGAAVDARDVDGRTPLLTLAWRDYSGTNVALMEILLAGGADLRARDAGGLGALALLTEAGRYHSPQDSPVWSLLRQAGATEDGLREVELRRAAGKGEREQVRALLQAGADVNAAIRLDDFGSRPVDWPAEQGYVRSALSEAVAGGHLELVRDLLAAGARADLRSVSSDVPDRSLVTLAVFSGSVEMVQALLAAGADAAQPDAFGHTPVMFAARARNAAVVAALRAAGTPVDPLAADYLKVLDFPGVAAGPEYQQARAELQALCGTEPLPVQGLEGVTCFRVDSRGALKELRKADPEMHRLNAEFLAHSRTLDALQEQVYASFRQRGFLVIQTRFSRFADTLLGLFPTTDPFAVVAAVGPYKKDDSLYSAELLPWLHALAAKQPFLLTGCAATSVTVEVTTPGEEPAALCEAGFEIAAVGEGSGRWRGCFWWDD
jgi:ankyrin repeat protein